MEDSRSISVEPGPAAIDQTVRVHTFGRHLVDTVPELFVPPMGVEPMGRGTYVASSGYA